jgi:hypothetical protein
MREPEAVGERRKTGIEKMRDRQGYNKHLITAQGGGWELTEQKKQGGGKKPSFG